MRLERHTWVKKVTPPPLAEIDEQAGLLIKLKERDSLRKAINTLLLFVRISIMHHIQ